MADKKQVVETIKKSMEELPPLSPVIKKIIEITYSPKSSAQDLADVILRDTVLTAKVLKMVNSAYFGPRNNFTNLKQSIVILGTNTVKNVALSSAVLTTLRTGKVTPLNEEEFWKYSFGVGVASKKIASLMGINSSQLEEFFVAGLIHDIGKVMISYAFPQEFKQIDEMSKKGQHSIMEIEKKVLGYSHEEIGIGMGKQWGFDEGYLYAIGKHHIPVLKGEFAKYSMIVALASYMVSSLEVSLYKGHMEPLPEDIWATIGVDSEKVMKSLSNINDDINAARVFLS